jgi:NADPH2:quinone reductase
MRAIGQSVFGGPEVLQTFVDVPTPAAGPRDLLVRVHAIATNPVDAKVRRGGGSVPNGPKILGWDASGVVESVGAEVQNFRPGDEVYFAGTITRQGAYAEFVAVDERLVAHKPKSLRHEDAAAIPLTALTAWEAFVENMGVAPTDHSSEAPKTALIVGGAGGVGSLAIQIAQRVCGLRTIATASRPETVEWCRRLGADAVIDHTQPLLPQLKTAGDDGVDYVLNTAPPEGNFSQVAEVLRPLGHVCGIVGPSGPLDVAPLFRKRCKLSFELMFTRSIFALEMERQGAILSRVAELLDQGVLVGTRTETSEIVEAHRRLDAGRSIGKTVLRVVPG